MKPETVNCRHCGAELDRIPAGWVDADGMFACVKAPLPQPVEPFPAPVLHEPMPAGLRGAPDG